MTTRTGRFSRTAIPALLSVLLGLARHVSIMRRRTMLPALATEALVHKTLSAVPTWSQELKPNGRSLRECFLVSRRLMDADVLYRHETGHTFGAVHDCESRACSDGTATRQLCCPLSASTCSAGERYIMNPSTGQGITDFSLCSIGNICSAIGRNSVRANCFSNNRNVDLITGQQCGNGIVEQGEQCDCGGEANCGDNPCCDPTTCQFRAGAVCDDSNEECCNNCQLATADTVCRPSSGECDPEERCSGVNATCPPDQTADNGQECGGGNGLRCASGQCTSRDQQCRTLMGSYTQNNDTYACDTYSCQLSCGSPEFGRGVCYGLQQNFLDGTPCGGGGRCQNVRIPPSCSSSRQYTNNSTGSM